MTPHLWSRRGTAALALGAGLAALPARGLRAATRQEIDAAVAPALARLREDPGTRALAENAKAILVFPRIVRAGFGFGGQYGNGALVAGGAPVTATPPMAAAPPAPAPAPAPVPEAPAAAGTILGYYNIAGASFGLQIGAQAYGLAMFFMTDGALDFFRRSAGWEVGTGPSVVALDAGMAGSLTSTTMTQDVYSVTFGQQGLMATLSLEGTKISRIEPG
jgi:lipid-binding SYLF domain-containing protein